MPGRAADGRAPGCWVAPPETLAFSLRAERVLRPGGRALVAGMILEYAEA